MAATVALNTTDEQIEQLLAEATTRLKQKEQSALATTNTNTSTLAFPKLDAGKHQDAFMKTNDNTTRINPHVLASKAANEASTGFRRVEDPLAQKQKALEVSKSLQSRFHEENLSQSLLEQCSSAVLVALLQNESSFIHSYSDQSVNSNYRRDHRATIAD